ncbi:hypothetical protein FHS55_003387 [Angulomicrobium tetraedrale]|uniref:Uncharacterized protein n=1 Tax=Ancylobacter tetraedralis TaxID=217068 RepID=A0A839ZDM6_9HYPH|nr:hypothetical protein [Ancylobacter tetraedralis]MBB3772766.1 hypothetical protein [Ancylobacter tetraedralis]
MRAIPICVELGNLFLEDLVGLGDAVGDELVKAPELVFRCRSFAREFIDPRLNLGIGLHPPVDDGL